MPLARPARVGYRWRAFLRRRLDGRGRLGLDRLHDVALLLGHFRCLPPLLIYLLLQTMQGLVGLLLRVKKVQHLALRGVVRVATLTVQQTVKGLAKSVVNQHLPCCQKSEKDQDLCQGQSPVSSHAADHHRCRLVGVSEKQ